MGTIMNILHAIICGGIKVTSKKGFFSPGEKTRKLKSGRKKHKKNKNKENTNTKTR